MNTGKRIAVYPGTFDPITNGHVDIIRRASPLFDKVYVTMAKNSSKLPLFDAEERLEMIGAAVAELDNVEVSVFEGLVVSFAKSVGAQTLIRGLRAVSDFEYEFQMSLMNRKQDPSLDTVFLMPDERYTYLSSSIVREIAQNGGKVDCFVPKLVARKLEEKFSQR